MDPFNESRIHPVETMRNDIDRLVVLRELTQEQPLQTLVGLLDELLADDWQSYNVSWAYHELASAIMHSGAPVVFGDRWRDWLLYAVLQRDNLYSLAVAAGREDDTLMSAMRSDMRIMQRLFLLDDSMIKHWCKELLRAGNELDADSSWATWSGSLAAPAYGTGPLAQMRAHLNLSEDWGQLPPVLAGYYKKHGSGSFLATRRLVWNGSSLSQDASPACAWGDLPGLGGQKEELRDCLTVPGAHIVLQGPAGCGKVQLVSGLANELEDFCVVTVDWNVPNAASLWPILAAQPLRFAVCFMGPSMGMPIFQHQSCPANVSIISVVDVPVDGPVLPFWGYADARILFTLPDEEDFTLMVEEGLRARGVSVPGDWLAERVRAGSGTLSVRRAQKMAESIAAQHEIDRAKTAGEVKI